MKLTNEVRLTNEQLAQILDGTIGDDVVIQIDPMARELLARRKLDDLFAEWCETDCTALSGEQVAAEAAFWWREHLKEAGCE